MAKSKWVPLSEGKRGIRYGLRCKDCKNHFLMVIDEPVKRQARTKTAHHRRVIAVCPICKWEHRLTLGPSH